MLVFRIDEKEAHDGATGPEGPKRFPVVRFNIPRVCMRDPNLHVGSGIRAIAPRGTPDNEVWNVYGVRTTRATSEYDHLAIGTLTYEGQGRWNRTIYRFNATSDAPEAKALDGKVFRRVHRHEITGNRSNAGLKWQDGDYRAQAWTLDEVDEGEVAARRARAEAGREQRQRRNAI